MPLGRRLPTTGQRLLQAATERAGQLPGFSGQRVIQKVGTSFPDQLQRLGDTERLIAAYQGMRNPFDTAARLAPEGQAALQEELRRRGVDVTTLQVTPGGQIRREGRELGRFLAGAGLLAAGGAAAGALGAGGAAGAAGAGGAASGAIPAALPGGVVGVGGAAIPTVAGTAATAAAPGILRRIGQGIIANPERALRTGLGVVGAVHGAQAAGRANELQRRALGSLFDANAVNPYADVGLDPGNPYQGQYRRQGQQALRAQLMR